MKPVTGRCSPIRPQGPFSRPQSGGTARLLAQPAALLLIVLFLFYLHAPGASPQGRSWSRKTRGGGRLAASTETWELAGSGPALVSNDLNDAGTDQSDLRTNRKRKGAGVGCSGAASEDGSIAHGTADSSSTRSRSSGSSSTADCVSSSSSYALEAEQRGWHPPRYSTHTCLRQRFTDNWHAATCKFDNVCLNSTSLQWQYYVDPALPDIPVLYDAQGVAMAEFAPHMVNMGHAKMDISPDVGWSPQVVRSSFPQGGPHMVWAPAPQALLQAFAAPLATNFGHVLFDLIAPLFNMQHLFGVYTRDAQPLILRAINGTDAELRAALPRLINTPDPAKSLLRLTWDRDAEWVAEYARRVLAGRPDGGGAGAAQEGLVCFKSVLVGTGSLNRQMAPVDALPYRQAAVRHLGLAEAPQTRPVITILNKQGRRTVENTGEMRAFIKARYPRAKVVAVDFGLEADLTMPQQVELMSGTSILVTPCGGLATVLAFMRPGATAIAFDYWHTGLNRSMQLEDNYYRHIEYLDIQYLPVTPDDYANTTDRPSCENVEGGSRPQDAHYPLIGALVHCNVRLGAPGLQRLGHFVDHAMRRWAARTGRYEYLQQGQGQPPEGAQQQQAHEQHEQQQQQPQEQQQQRQQGGVGPGGSVAQVAR